MSIQIINEQNKSIKLIQLKKYDKINQKQARKLKNVTQKNENSRKLRVKWH